MKNCIYIFIKLQMLVFICLFSFKASFAIKTDSLKTFIQKSILPQKQKVKFIENKGQFVDMNHRPVPNVLFKAQTKGINLYITAKGITYVFLKLEEENVVSEMGLQEKSDNIITHWERVDMELKGANISINNVFKEYPLITNHNFFLAHCQDGIYGVKEYEKITIKEVYPGIDWVIHNSSNDGFKYDFIVHPGANPDHIELVYSSTTPLVLNHRNELEIKTAYGNIVEHTPFSYLLETKKEINSKFKITNQKEIANSHYETSVSFLIDKKAYSNNATLVIDPDLVWATFVGGSNQVEGPSAIDIDADGNAFVAGYVQVTDFPVVDNGTYFQGTLSGDGTREDLLILKFDNDGVLIWATYYGGTDDERATAVAVDSDGEVFVAGFSKSTSAEGFPFYNPPGGTEYFDNTCCSSYDMILLKFDNDGNRLWATAFGAQIADSEPTAIDINSSGELYVVGYTHGNSTNIDELDQGGSSFYDGSPNGIKNGIILKFANDGTQLWTTFFGGNSQTVINSVFIDAEDNVLMTGYTTSSSPNIDRVNPGGTSYYDGSNAGAGEAFISKFNSNDSLIWSTYYGGTGRDEGHCIIADDSLNIFVLGSTSSTDFPVLDIAYGAFYQSSNGGGSSDAFIAKFEEDGTQVWSTYYGGSGAELRPDVSNLTFGNLAVNGCGHLYVSFEISSNDITTQDYCDAGHYYDNSYNTVADSNDMFLAAFSNHGHLIWGSYFGGDGASKRCPIAIDANGSLWTTGEWTDVGDDATYPVIDPGGSTFYDATFNGGIDDGFIAKFTNDLDPCPCYSYLPISLVSFTGECSNGAVNLNWKTASETNNDFFTIEYSFDAVHWNIATTLKGAGNSSVIQNYSFTHYANVDNIIYYRLKQTDYDGRFEYFNMIPVVCDDIYSQFIEVFPNPGVGLFEIKGINEVADVIIYNSLGEMVYKNKTSDSKFKVDISNQSNGLYSVVIQTPTKNIVKKISVKK